MAATHNPATTRSTYTPQFLVIGAGSRGHAYACGVTAATSGVIAAVAEPDEFKRREFGRKYIWGSGTPGPHQEYAGWEEWIEWETKRRTRVAHAAGTSTISPSLLVSGLETGYLPITGVFICTLDETHARIIHALTPLNLHIMCEKPLALSLTDCLSISRSISLQPPKIFSIGHVLRYSPHNILLRKLLVEQMAIGEIVSIEHTEPVGWWHFAHSYVRGNWRRETAEGVGSLLTKSCHDIDFLLWLMCSPSPLTGQEPHPPSTIFSTGSLTQFRKARKPYKAATATNCFDCAAESDCIYSAKKIYRDKWLRKERYTGWPLKIVVPEIEDISVHHGWDAAENRLEQALKEDYDRSRTADDEVKKRSWYGRCVYESDNNVNDEQTVIMTWEDDVVTPPLSNGNGIGATATTNGHQYIEHSYAVDKNKTDIRRGRGPKTALFHMTAPTQAQCVRRGRIYGTLGELTYDSSSITIHHFPTNTTKIHTLPKQPPEVEAAHGGGDWGLAKAFVDAVCAVESGELGTRDAQWKFIGADLEEIIRSHAVVFCAEEARRRKEVVDWKTWWENIPRR